jgi:DNA-directed RNA polymerase specialized sigma subunit
MKELNLIRKIAWSFHKTTGIEIEELYSEACLAYCEALHNYDQSRGKITTFMWAAIHNHMKNYLIKYYQKQPILLSFEDIKVERSILIDNLFEKLSPDGQSISQIILMSSRAYVCLDQTKAKQRITTIMLNKGWSMCRIWSGIKELKSVFS